MNSIRVEVRVAAGTRVHVIDATYVVPHEWTGGGIAVESGGTGPHLLLTAVAACVLNDVYREAQETLTVDGVLVEAGGDFDTDTWSTTSISYDVALDSADDPAAVRRVVDRVDTVAEIPKVVRGAVTVARRSPRVRRARAGDVAALHELGEVVVPATYAALDPVYAELISSQWWTPGALADSLARIPHWVAEDAAGRVVGVANLGEHDGVATMWKLYVHPAHQGAGVGTTLLREVVAAAGRRPLELEVVEGNDRAFAFYRRHGFEEIRRTPERAHPSATLIWMRKHHG